MKVPGYSEMTIPVKVEGSRGEIRCGTVGPPSLAHENRRGIVIGRTLVDLNKDCVPVRIVNLSSERKK